MDPVKWGPHLWFFLHTISFTFPQNPTYDNKLKYLEFYNSLKYMLPCELCRTHYIQHIQHAPPNTNSRKDLVIWTIDLHNRVNKSLNKREYTYQEVIELYRGYFKNIDYNNELRDLEYSTTTEDSNHTFLKYFQISGLTLVLIVLTVYLFNNRRTAIKKIIRY